MKSKVSKKRRANPRIRTKRTSALTDWEKTQKEREKLLMRGAHGAAVKLNNELVLLRENIRSRIQSELAEARTHRKMAYNVGLLGERWRCGVKLEGGFRNSADDEIRRLYCDMWVASLHRLYKLILGLAPKPDETEKKYPIKQPHTRV